MLDVNNFSQLRIGLATAECASLVKVLDVNKATLQLFEVESKEELVQNLGKGVELISKCDTVKYTLLIPETNYTVIFNDTIANLRSKGLFYPDIEYLPYQIIGIGPDKSTMTLEEVIYGKSAIDSILQQYDYKGYLQITDADFSPADIQNVKDLIERYSKIK